MTNNPLREVCGVIRQHSCWPSQKILDVLYGPQAKHLRVTVATILHGRNITPSAKEAQYVNRAFETEPFSRVEGGPSGVARRGGPGVGELYCF